MEDKHKLYGQIVEQLLQSWGYLNYRLKQSYIRKTKPYRRRMHLPEHFTRIKLQRDLDIFKIKEEVQVSCDPEDFFEVSQIVAELEEVREHLKIKYFNEKKVVFFVIKEDSEYEIEFFEPNESELDYYIIKFILESYTLLSFEEYRQKNALKIWRGNIIFSSNEVSKEIMKLMNHFTTNNSAESYNNINKILLNEKPSMDGLFRIYCNIKESSRTQSFFEYLKERK